MTTLTDDQLTQALAEYDVPHARSVRLLNDGNNTTYSIGAEQTHVLRVHRPAFRALEHTRSELVFMQYLHDRLAGIDIPRPVAARSGDLVVPLGDGRHADLQTWVDGRPVHPDDGLDETAARLLGHTLAQVHQAAEEFEPPADFRLPRWNGDGMFVADASPFRPLLSREEILSEADLRDFADLERRARDVFAELDSHSGTYGIIHFDYILGNIHLSGSGRGLRSGVIDFDDCGYGYFLYDLGPILGNLINHPALRRAVLDGYRRDRPFPPEWDNHIPVMMAARHAAMCYWTAGAGVSPTPREDAAWRMGLARSCLAAE